MNETRKKSGGRHSFWCQFKTPKSHPYGPFTDGETIVSLRRCAHCGLPEIYISPRQKTRPLSGQAAEIALLKALADLSKAQNAQQATALDFLAAEAIIQQLQLDLATIGADAIGRLKNYDLETGEQLMEQLRNALKASGASANN